MSVRFVYRRSAWIEVVGSVALPSLDRSHVDFVFVRPVAREDSQGQPLYLPSRRLGVAGGCPVSRKSSRASSASFCPHSGVTNSVHSVGFSTASVRGLRVSGDADARAGAVRACEGKDERHNVRRAPGKRQNDHVHEVRTLLPAKRQVLLSLLQSWACFTYIDVHPVVRTPG